jgi:hypothetical protein
LAITETKGSGAILHIAATTAACQGVWLARLLAEFKGKKVRAYSLKMDSQSAIQLSKNPVFHDRSKHIDTCYHFICECVEHNRVRLEFIRTAEELADILTKALGRERFCELRSKIGVIDVQSVCKT